MPGRASVDNAVEVARRADILSVHVALNEHTKGLHRPTSSRPLPMAALSSTPLAEQSWMRWPLRTPWNTAASRLGSMLLGRAVFRRGLPLRWSPLRGSTAPTQGQHRAGVRSSGR